MAHRCSRPPDLNMLIAWLQARLFARKQCTACLACSTCPAGPLFKQKALRDGVRAVPNFKLDCRRCRISHIAQTPSLVSPAVALSPS